jgi:histidinol-phosphate aminotransferase
MTLTATADFGGAPAPRIGDREPYTSACPPHPIDLWLNSNEGLAPPPDLLDQIRGSVREVVRRYPNVTALEELIAGRLNQPRECVLATAGADDAIYRACMTMLDRGREIILPVPTFEMIERYAQLAGGTIFEVSWMGGPYPTEAVLAQVTRHTAMIALVSPNNPTGAVANAEDLRELSAAAPNALLLVDLAYTEFADQDLTRVALTLPNALIVRTLSKACGLAGLRVGYAIGPANVVRWLRTAGNPYAVSGLSATLAAARLGAGDQALRSFTQRVRAERAALTTVLRETGAAPLPSQANFVLARFPDALTTWNELARRGIAVRSFRSHPRLEDYLRITCPCDPASFARLVDTLRQVSTRIQ